MQPLLPTDPTRIGSYQLMGRLGAGGMGRVFLGTLPSGRRVAVKVIHPHYAADPGFRARFAREIEAARQVGGFYTAPVVGADPDADPPWMATAYVPGPTLNTAVGHHGPLPAESVAALAAGLAEGLAAIHTCGLVHRDLKPGNVILAADGPRIIDFGVARSVGASPLTADGAVVGTLAYMSPEQLGGGRVGPPSDVFSLGGVLVFAAAGHGPFDADSVPVVARRISEHPPDVTGVSTALREVVGRCLLKAPAARPTPEQLSRMLAAPAGRRTVLPGWAATDVHRQVPELRDGPGRRSQPPAAPGAGDPAPPWSRPPSAGQAPPPWSQPARPARPARPAESGSTPPPWSQPHSPGGPAPAPGGLPPPVAGGLPPPSGDHGAGCCDLAEVAVPVRSRRACWHAGAGL